jgi:hypothetical protein
MRVAGAYAEAVVVFHAPRRAKEAGTEEWQSRIPFPGVDVVVSPF